MDRSRRSGFTLMELLVVISIIVIVATMSLPFLAMLRKGTSLKHSAEIFEMELVKGRQEAINKRQQHYLLIFNASDDSQGYIELWRDDDNDETWDGAPTDTLVEDTRMLAKNVKWQSSVGLNPASGRGSVDLPPIIINSDGTCYVVGVPDVLTANVTCTLNTADLYLYEGAFAGDQGKRMLLDIITMTGRVNIVNCLR